MERGRTSQSDVESAVLALMVDRRRRTTAEIQAGVKVKVPPTDADNLRASKRTNESRYDQIISNALEKGRRLICDGLLLRVSEGCFQITDKGIGVERSEREQVTRMVATLNEMAPEEDWG